MTQNAGLLRRFAPRNDDLRTCVWISRLKTAGVCHQFSPCRHRFRRHYLSAGIPAVTITRARMAC
jgi:hypothetical protein